MSTCHWEIRKYCVLKAVWRIALLEKRWNRLQNPILEDSGIWFTWEIPPQTHSLWSHLILPWEAPPSLWLLDDSFHLFYVYFTLQAIAIPYLSHPSTISSFSPHALISFGASCQKRTWNRGKSCFQIIPFIN